MSQLTRFIRALLSLSVNHPWLIVTTFSAITVLLIPFIPRIKLQLNARSLVPAGHPDLAASDRASDLFAIHDVVVLAVIDHDSQIYNRDTLSCIDRISTGLAKIDGIIPSSVTSITTQPLISVKDNKIDMRPLSFDGQKDPVEEIERARRYIESMGLNDGLLVARDGSAALVLAQIEPTADRAAVFDQVKAIASNESVGSRSIQLSGTALAEAVLGQASARDLLRLIPLTIILLAVALTIGFRHPAPAFICLLEIGLSLIWTIGIMGLTGQSVFVTTLVMPVILISVGVSDDVYVLKHVLRTRQSSGSEETVNAFSEMFGPVSLTAISTVVGLLSLTTTNLAPYRVFGFFGALAVLSSTLFTFTLVPALVKIINPQVRSKRNSTHKQRSSGIGSIIFQTILAAGPRRVLVVTFAITVIALVLTTKLRVDDSWIRNLPASNEVSRGDEAINNVLAGTTTIDLMFAPNQKDQRLEPQSLLQLLSMEEALSKVSQVGATYGIHDDILRLNAVLHQLDYATYRGRLLRGEMSISREEIDQALILLNTEKRFASRDDVLYQRPRLTVFIRSANYERIDTVLRAICGTTNFSTCGQGQIVPFGDGWISYVTVRLLVNGQIMSIALALLVDLLLLTILLRSLRLGLTAIIPVAFSVLMIFALLVGLGIPLGIANSMFASIAIGIGLDFAIHLTAKFGYAQSRGAPVETAMHEAMVTTTPAITMSALAITLGFSVLALSQIMPNRQLGLMICLGLTLTALATLILVPTITLATNSRR
ncbi:MAG TPA: MMPL family transporter [Pyrinomonadaceae bacterium]